MLEEGGSSISPTVSSVTDLPIPSQKSTGDLKGRTPPLLRKPSRIKHRPQDDIEVQSLSQGEDVLLSPSDNDRLTFHAILASRTKPRSVHLTDLPIEVQEGIIDHLAGNLLSTTSDVSSIRNGCRNWSVAMRHPRRRQLTDLALISRTWRRLIQERLFRHSME